MDSMPEKPYQEFVMALSGPLVNLAIAVPLGIIVLGMTAAGAIRSLSHFAYLLGTPSWQGFVLNLFISNMLLALFNLLPAFPMDGGRVLRSALAWGLGQRRATRLATRVGQFLAIVLATIGLFPPSGVRANPVLVVIGLFVFAGAQQEERASEILAVLGDLRVGQAVITTCQVLALNDTLDTVLDHTLRGHPACFGVVEDGRLVGLLNHDDIAAALETYGHSVPVRDIMQRQFRSVSASDTLAKAWQLMAASGRRALPVTQDGQWLGMVTAQQIGQIQAFLAARQRGQRT
jgi:CBS domain-containing protein